ncbi:chemotaxis protein CheW [Colwellia sp. M166]|uniref:chemotaxis protein CheW n=1 Tax=Colwellia sp. M166 TaxID=2583805 RepID=UPI00211DB112|nr:chemotaxis protein CheW [Colwellia sp. M166]
MSKSLAASKQLMQTYLSELLTEEEEQKALLVKVKQTEPLERLLASATFPKTVEQETAEPIRSAKAENKTLVATQLEIDTPVKTTVKPVVKAKPAKINTKVIDKKVLSSSSEVQLNELKTRKSVGGFEAINQRSYRQGDFQAMFFDVAGLMIAVPLIELGGILNNDKTSSLMGKPDWFKGVMLHRDEKVNVVDTARWVMPEKCDETLLAALNYQYIIMLSNTSWGLTAEKLIDTVTLKQEDVKWLDAPSKRPWLAGLVKNRMCALLDVDSLIKLLEKGVNITQE